MRAPSSRIASPTMYIDPVITTTASGRAGVRASFQGGSHVRGFFDLGRSPGRGFSNLVRRGGSGIIGAGRNHPLRQRKQDFRHFSDRLIAHRAKNKNQGTLRVASREGGAQRPRSRRVMRHVEYIFGLAGAGGHHLEPSRPMGFANTPFDRGSRHRKPLPAQFLGGRNRQSDISQLVPPDQRRFDQNLLAHHLQRIT